MKRLVVYIACICLVLAAAPSGFAVEKKGKGKAKTSQVQKKSVKPAAKKAVPKYKQVPTPRTGSKKYDTFVDRNKNGVDDRKEHLKKKTAPKPKPVSKSDDKKKK